MAEIVVSLRHLCDGHWLKRRRHIDEVGGDKIFFDAGEAYQRSRWPSNVAVGAGSAVLSGALTSPMPGRIVSVSAEPGARVVKGQPIVALEAMKMEHALIAPFDGKLVELNVKVGDQVVEGATLARVEAD